MITSDIELLEVFYAHTISPAAIAFLFTIVMCLFSWLFPLAAWGSLRVAAYLIGGDCYFRLGISKLSGATE